MSDKSGYHSPLMGGITIMPRTGAGAGGTLTAVARRTSDDAKVLVTNVHVVSTEDYELRGTESIYQWDANNANGR